MTGLYIALIIYEAVVICVALVSMYQYKKRGGGSRHSEIQLYLMHFAGSHIHVIVECLPHFIAEWIYNKLK